MKAPWCEGLPIVTMPRRDTANPVTVIYPYYENGTFLERQLQHWATFASDLRANASLIIVDDGSPLTPAAAIMRAWKIGWKSVRTFRIDVDVPWNWIAARNIGFHHAADGWCLVTDMDHVIREETMRSVIYSDHDPGTIYAFRRLDVKEDDAAVEIHPHPNSWLMTRAMFWDVGGYDETLSGHYGTDGDWRRRCAKVAPIEILTDVLLRYEHREDSSTTRYQRKLPADTAAVKSIVANRPGRFWRPRILSFPYHEVGW